METVLKKTTKQDQQLAQSLILEIRQADLAFRHSGFAKIKIQEEGEFLPIPKKAFHLLVEILSNMADGKSITLIPSEVEMSTQQAANMLNVSRPHIVKLLEEKVIPFKKVGTHRRIELKHLIEYEKKLKQNRKQNLDFLAQQAQELNLGY